MQIQPPQRLWRKYARFHLRTLAVLLVVIAGSLGWLAHRANVQHDAVRAIVKAGGYVKYDSEWKFGGPVSGGQLPGPKWLVDLFDVNYLGHVVVVRLAEKGSDAVLASVGRLRRLKTLDLQRSSVTDTGLRELENLTELQDLTLDRTTITDAGLAHLEPLTQLKALTLYKDHITDAGLQHLRSLKNLQNLILADTGVTDAGLAELRSLTNLRWLFLERTKVTDSGLAQLQGLTRLTV
jgi:hypothetical protein